MANCKEASKKEWSTDKTYTSIAVGALQRIADATEKMASNYQRQQDDLEYYKKRTKDLAAERDACGRRRSALLSVITKLKNKNARLRSLRPALEQCFNTLINVCPADMKGDPELIQLFEEIERRLAEVEK